jgi:prepilin-type N-terminal cleavage/methylation domain-containing protein
MKGCSAVRTNGFTLIEMLTVVAIFGLVAIYVGRVLTVNERAYHTVENTSESQQNLRVFGELIEDDIRHAGLMVPRDGAVCGVDNANAPDILYVSDGAAIDPQDDFTPYTGATITAPAGTTNLTVPGTVTLTLASLIIEPSPPSRPAYDTNNDGTADSDFRVNGGVIVFDTASAARGNACGTITAVNIGTKQITVTGTAAMAAGAGTALVAIPANEYRVVGNQLRWNGIALADGIEDFQVGYVFDFDGDNMIDTPPNDELRGFTTSGTGSTAYLSSALPPNQMRELRIGIVSRSRMTDPTYVGGRPQALLNRTAITTADTYRRRTYEGRVLLRNLATRIGS